MPSHPCRLFRGANKINAEDFQTCNDLVMCALRDDSGLLQVWHRQFPVYFLDIRAHSLLTSDGLAVPIVPQPRSSKCYSWNHDTAQFHSEYSSDGRLFACWSDTGSLVRVWDTQTNQLVGMFPTSCEGPLAYPDPLATDSSLFGIASETQFLYRPSVHLGLVSRMHIAFIQDGTRLVYCPPDFSKYGT